MTFSKSLADHVSERAGARTERFDLIVGRALGQHESSSSGLYALLSARTGKTLRVALSKEEANLLCDFDSRRMHEAWIQPSRSVNGSTSSVMTSKESVQPRSGGLC